MIFIKFKKGQGLGNQLWSYVTLRSIAKYKSYDYKVLDFEFFKGFDILSIKETNNNYELIDYSKLKLFREKLYYDNDLNCLCADYDKSILNLNDNSLLEGIFQSERYLIDTNKVLNEFIKINPKKRKQNKTGNNTCILNIRGGEYKRHKDLILPKSYWINGMKNMKNICNSIEFKIVTDDEKYAEKLLPDVEILKGDISNDFLYIQEAKYIIVSNSSFAYFPINLGKKPILTIAPLLWSRFNNKFKRWASPANYYPEWAWQDYQGNIISKKNINKILKITRDEYSTYNIGLKKYEIKKNIFLLLIPKGLKKLIKYILNYIFPLHFG
ncbi:MAG: hypothetical protein CBC84_001800 [Pelagibacteraceae bacterium TMED124]|nr:MAG: hypothetical protein CBC84_001800 [Pelagibacteraceae bacterium TMED124]|tara:strand:- start:43 stop:1020 length:978 start_codon:yes stop_codon:yes gene_type:complete